MQRTETVEWRTLAVIVCVYAGLLAAVLTHRLLPAPLTVALLSLFSAWHSSLQHEVIHGHPTAWPHLNRALVALPVGLLIPYDRYRVSHTMHHNDDESLTDPILDPESTYVTPGQWQTAGSWLKVWLWVQRTAIGRMVIGPARAAALFLVSEARLVRHDRHVRAVWVRHCLGVALLLMCVRLVSVPLWQYVVGAGYFGLSWVMLRSLAEHRGVLHGTRSAVVKAGPFWSLLYLNNNLHYSHHAQPWVAWYRLPQLNRDLHGDDLAAQGAGLYAGGYGEIFRRYGFRPFCQPVHPVIDHNDD